MFYSLIQAYADMIADYQVTDFRRFGSAHALVARLTLTDQSFLYIRDYLFEDGRRKYVFHWQEATGQLRIRWDNSPHHPEIATFPHHKHDSNGISPSQERTLADVLEIIRQRLGDYVCS